MLSVYFWKTIIGRVIKNQISFSHKIFFFQGVAIQSKRCAMCRAEIPTDYLDHPVLLEKLTQQETSQEDLSEEYQWYYEGRNGKFYENAIYTFITYLTNET